MYQYDQYYKSREKSIQVTQEIHVMYCATVSRQEIRGRDELLLTDFAPTKIC